MQSDEKQQRQRGGEAIAHAGDDLAPALVGASVVVGARVPETIASWPWPVHRRGGVTPAHAVSGWEHERSSDWFRLCVAASNLHFSAEPRGLLYLLDGAPLWRIDLALYPVLLQNVLTFSADHGHSRFGFVAEDGKAGILSSRYGDAHDLCCWGL